ncbi:unnamed protein product [Euphydryas editha]|uniref:Uncharacterized protein n=1 Tax=Euphydryas editha TaxID=104508 RepID=A0AAU9U051_EUPED|nr:unnamed protein product [Euphydryas editha]
MLSTKRFVQQIFPPNANKFFFSNGRRKACLPVDIRTSIECGRCGRNRARALVLARISVTSGVWIDVDRRCGSTTGSTPSPCHTPIGPQPPDYCNRIPPRLHLASY